MKKIELFADGPTLDEIKNLQNIDGYTFNPSLFTTVDLPLPGPPIRKTALKMPGS